MIVIYGTDSKLLAEQGLPKAVCPLCDSKGTLQVGVFATYAHVFWLPLFSLGKRGISSCGFCGQTLPHKKMHPECRELYERLKSGTSIPYFHFAGVALFSGIAFLIWFGIQRTAHETETLLASPQQGDIYEIKKESGDYTLFKIDAVTEDSVFFLLNNNTFANPDPLRNRQMREDASFFPVRLAIHKSEVLEWKESGRIIDIDRGRDEFILH